MTTTEMTTTTVNVTATILKRTKADPHSQLLRFRICLLTLTAALLMKTTVFDNNHVLRILTASSIADDEHHHGQESTNHSVGFSRKVEVLNDRNNVTISEVLRANQSLPTITEILEQSAKNSSLPPWLHEYIEWHYDTVSKLTEANWNNQKYFLLRCVKGDRMCAGASDRLKTIPVMLRIARNSNRIFLIHWSRPCRIEEFLVPSGKLNWTVPEWLAHKLDVEATYPVWKFDSTHPNAYAQKNDTVIRVKNIHYASDMYDAQVLPGEEPMWMAYHDIWKAVFKPSPNVQHRIDVQLHTLGLIPHHYIAAHVRAVYVKNTTTQPAEINAIHCAAELLAQTSPGPITNATAHTTEASTAPAQRTLDWPIYMASDSVDVKIRATRYGHDHGLRVVGTLNQSELLHLDRGRDFLAKSDDWKNRPPSDFYDTFVDLYMLALAGGTTSGVGGFGSWGTVIGTAFHSNLWNNHQRKTCSSMIPSVPTLSS